MRSVLLALSCLVVGVLGALGYSHYLGEGKQLAELQDDLSAAKTSLAKVTQDEADQALEVLLRYGVNHLDVAAGAT